MCVVEIGRGPGIGSSFRDGDVFRAAQRDLSRSSPHILPVLTSSLRL